MPAPSSAQAPASTSAALSRSVSQTGIPDKCAPCQLDHVNRVFDVPAPNRLWVSDFTCVSTWSGFVYVAFAIDAYTRRLVGWRVSRAEAT